MRKFGFTLAEVLITLAVIGVVAAIVLPTVATNVQKQALEKQTLKFYSQVQAFAKNYLATDGGFNGNLSPDVIRKQFNITEICDYPDNCPQWDTTYKGINGESIGGNPFWGTIYKLADGTVFKYRDYDNGQYGLRFIFDVNGVKGPNVLGKDFWYIIISEDGSIRGYTDAKMDTPKQWLQKTPEEIRTLQNNNYENKCLKATNAGYDGCFDHFVNNNFKFDY